MTKGIEAGGGTVGGEMAVERRTVVAIARDRGRETTKMPLSGQVRQIRQVRQAVYDRYTTGTTDREIHAQVAALLQRR